MIERTPWGYRGRGLHGDVVERLGQRILSGELAEGGTLEVAELEAEFDVSRSVIREAMRVLGAKGLIDARQKRGTIVRPRTEWSLLDADVIRWQFEGHNEEQLLGDLAELREVIEPASAGLAAHRRTDRDLVAMEEALDRMSAATRGQDDAVEADLAFHRALLAATHNELLIRTEAVLSVALAVRDRLVHEAPHSDPTGDHATILQAIRDADPDAAVIATSALLTKSQRDVDRLRHGNAQTEKQKRQP